MRNILRKGMAREYYAGMEHAAGKLTTAIMMNGHQLKTAGSMTPEAREDFDRILEHMQDLAAKAERIAHAELYRLDVLDQEHAAEWDAFMQRQAERRQQKTAH